MRCSILENKKAILSLETLNMRLTTSTKAMAKSRAYIVVLGGTLSGTEDSPTIARDVPPDLPDDTTARGIALLRGRRHQPTPSKHSLSHVDDSAPTLLRVIRLQP
jgi:hypothetical protein